MPVFSNTEELYGVMCELWEGIKADKAMSDKLLASRLIVRFNYREPDGKLTIDASDGQTIKVVPHESDVKPDIEMSMTSDVAHRFWLGKENPSMAILQGKITSRGPVSKALALLPAVKSAFRIYPRIVDTVLNADDRKQGKESAERPAA